MEICKNREQTFQEDHLEGTCRWPHPVDGSWRATPQTLADAGFYYDPFFVGDDRVCCYTCNLVMSNWRQHHDPMERHQKEFVECPLVQSRLKTGRLASNTRKASRRQTFGKWWPHKSTKDKPFLAMPSKLAEAGFIYSPTVKNKDLVSCPLCGLKVHSWKPNMDPIEAHKKKSECEFIKEYIEMEEQKEEQVRSRTSSIDEEIATPKRKAGNQIQTIVKIENPAIPRSASSHSIDTFVQEKNQPLKKRKALHAASSTATSSAVSPVDEKPLDLEDRLVTLQKLADGLKSGLEELPSLLSHRRVKDDKNMESSSRISHMEQELVELKEKHNRLLRQNAESTHDHSVTTDAINKLKEKIKSKDLDLAVKELTIQKHEQTIQALKASNSHSETQGLLAEMEKLKRALATAKEETTAWKNSWENLSRESDKIQKSHMTGNNSTAISTTGRNIVSLPPAARRSWYEGELHLFSSRTGLNINNNDEDYSMVDFKVPFLSMSDIPWPIPPSLPASTVISGTMIESFLLNGLGHLEKRKLGEKIAEYFDQNSLNMWSIFVIEKDRAAVKDKAADVVKCIKPLLS